jgi:amidase
VRVLQIQLASFGIMPVSPGLGVLGDRVHSSTTRLLPLQDGAALFPGGVSIRIKPMIGLVAVAPPRGPVPTSVPGDHGGNMDVRDVTEGATVYLPVLVPGALLVVGDLHARMGDGEVGGTGVEVAGSVLVEVDALPGLQIGSKMWKVHRPVVDTGEAIVFVGTGDSLPDAIRVATWDATSFISLVLDMDFADAYRLCSIAGDLQFGQVVNARPTVKLVVPKKELGLEA